MGLTPSANGINVDELDLTYFSVQMDLKDRFRLVLAPDHVVKATHAVLSLTWPVQSVLKRPIYVEVYMPYIRVYVFSSSSRLYSLLISYFQFKLSGQPWYSTGEENLNVKNFMCSLLKQYYELGWWLSASSDLQRTNSDTSVLFFEKRTPLTRTSVVCLSLNSTDKIRILGTERVYSLVKQTIKNTWPRKLLFFSFLNFF